MAKNPKHIPLRVRKSNFYERRRKLHEKEKKRTVEDVLAEYRQNV